MYDLFISFYSWYLVGHIISVIAWMAGIFYLPRLFVYHSEEVNKNSDTDRLFIIMEHRLLNVIMVPAMISSWFFWSLSFYYSWSCRLGGFLAVDKTVKLFTTYRFSFLAQKTISFF
jgi:uncharacterized integral membrane protein (TIGR00701 family)